MAMPDAHVNKNLEGGGFRATVQRFGGYLAGMIMPNIGAFIAWGLITALFIPTGWLPNEKLAELVGPMIIYLLPLLIGYTGGRMVHGQRGAVIGAIATMGVIVGTTVPMFLGAMLDGSARGLPAQAARRGDRGQDPVRLRDADRQLLARHPRWWPGDPGSARHRSGRPGGRRLPRQRRGRAGGEQLAPAGLALRGTGEDPVPEQCDQPGRPDATRRRRRPGGRQVDPVHGRDQPRARPRHPARLPALRPQVDASHRSRCAGHPLPRRDPRDLLPVRADEAEAGAGRDRRRHVRPADRDHPQRRPGLGPLARQHLRLPGGHAPGWLLPGALGDLHRHRGVLRGRLGADGLRPRREGRGAAPPRGRGHRRRPEPLRARAQPGSARTATKSTRRKEPACRRSTDRTSRR